MAKEKSAAVATVVGSAPSAALAAAPTSELAALLGDMSFDVDGLGSVDNEDIKITSLLFNLKGQDPKTGKLRQLNQILNTTTEEYAESVTIAFVDWNKTNSWRQFDSVKNKSETICSSMDRKKGLLRMVHPRTGQPVGLERPCEKCPDMAWRKDEKTGKNTRDCASVYNVYGALLDADLAPTDAFLVRFARTSAPSFKNHINKHHIGKHPTLRGKNVPLFLYAVDLTLEVDKGGNFAVPVFGPPRILPKSTIEYLAEQCKHWREMGEEYQRAAEKTEASFGGGDAIDTEGTSAATNADDFADAGR